MKVVFFARKMPDLCGAFLHDIDLATELQKQGHQVVFLTTMIPKEGVNGGTYHGLRYLHYSANTSFLDTSQLWVCPHAPVLPEVRRLNAKGYNRPIVFTCHYDGNYLTVSANTKNDWSEMACFINRIMEPNYRKHIIPWPSSIVKTQVIRPIMRREKITITEPFRGDCITLVNANQNKGVHVFLDLAKRMPSRKFLGVLPYYGITALPPGTPNIEWIPFDDDVRNILRRTRILLVPSYYESFCRIAVESMINGIPVLYSKPTPKSIYPGGSTEGMQEWIGAVAIACEREEPTEWMSAIQRLDDEDEYQEVSQRSKEHIESLDLFSEAPRIVKLLESFATEHPVVVRAQQSAAKTNQDNRAAPMLRAPTNPEKVGFGFSNGRLRIQR
jgi:glycosyltransferase involved in cell wall biosynthesis